MQSPSHEPLNIDAHLLLKGDQIADLVCQQYSRNRPDEYLSIGFDWRAKQLVGLVSIAYCVSAAQNVRSSRRTAADKDACRPGDDGDEYHSNKAESGAQNSASARIPV
jgi:hypothetical protein